jgi:hypothetical protein
MKNLVLMFCAVVALFSFSSCEKCLNCVKVTPECGFCDYGANGNGVTYCNNGNAAYNTIKADCIAQSGTWKIATAATSDDQKVCGNSSSAAQDKATVFQLNGYTCK